MGDAVTCILDMQFQRVHAGHCQVDADRLIAGTHYRRLPQLLAVAGHFKNHAPALVL